MANLSSTRIFGDGTVERSLYVKQRLGVGVGNPDNKIHVRSPQEAILKLEADTDNSDETDHAQVQFSQDDGDVTGFLGYANGLNSLRLENTFSDSIILATNGNERVTIESGGNVGIGTTSPDALLDVNGATIINNQGFATRSYEKLSVQGSGVGVSARDGSKFIYLYAKDGNTFKLDAYDDSTNNGIDIEIAANGGNVGIGTTSPSNDLDINTSSNDSGISFGGSEALTGTTGNGWLRLNQDNDFSNGVYTPGLIRADGNGDNRAAEFRDDVDMSNNNIRDVNNIRVDNGSIIGINGGPEIEFESNGIEIQGVERLSFGDQSGSVDGLDMGGNNIKNVNEFEINSLRVSGSFYQEPNPDVGKCLFSFGHRTSDGATEENWKIAELPASSSSTGDLIYVELIGGEYPSNQKIHATMRFGNRGGFTGSLDEHYGDNPNNPPQVKAFEKGDGTIDIVLTIPSNSWKGGAVKVWEASGINTDPPIIFENPSNLGSSVSGTRVFSSKDRTPGIKIRDNGNVGAKTRTPSATFDVGSGNLRVSNGNIVLPSGSGFIGNSNSQSDPNIEFEGGGMEFTGGGALFGGGSPPGGSGNVDIKGRLSMSSQIEMNNNFIDNADRIEINGAGGRTIQVRGGANTTDGLSVRTASNVPSDRTMFAVESSGGATRFGVTQNNGAFFRNQLWVNSGGTTDDGEIGSGFIEDSSPSEVALRLGGGIGFRSPGTFADTRIEAPTNGNLNLRANFSSVDIGDKIVIDGNDGIEFNAEFETIEFRDIGNNAAIVFKDVFNNFPTNNEIENVLEDSEATIFAYEQFGNINLGWAETDGSGNVQNRDNVF